MRLPAPGETFGSYRIDAPIGRGGMGVVFRASHVTLGRAVALKVLRDDDDPDPERIARFVREARLVAALSHPGIVGIYDAGVVAGTAYLAMEWVEGRSLRDAIRAGDLTLSARIHIARTLAESIAFAHEHGIIHRDLKPGNVMLDARGSPKLLDFGLAKRVVRSVPPGPLTFATRDDVVIGTMSYMAPEQMISMDVDGRADQFSWAVTAYELILGNHPRTTTGDERFPFTPAKSLSAVVPGVPPALAGVIARALAAQRAARFDSMRDLLAAWPDVPGAPLAARDVPTVVDRAPAGAAAAPPRHGFAVFLASTALVVVLGVGAALVFYLRSRVPGPAQGGDAGSPDAAITSAPSVGPLATADPSDAASTPDAPGPKRDASAAQPGDPRFFVASDLRVEGMPLEKFASREAGARAVASIARAARPCLVGKRLTRGASVDLVVDLQSSGNLLAMSAADSCVGAFCSQAGIDSWLPPGTSDCVVRAARNVTFPPLAPEVTNGASLRISVVPR